MIGARSMDEKCELMLVGWFRNATPLIGAVGRGNVGCVAHLLYHGARVDSVDTPG